MQWYDFQKDWQKERAFEYHLSTIQYVSKIRNVLFELDKWVWEAGEFSSATVTEPRQQRRRAFYLQRSHHVTTLALDKIIDLQHQYRDPDIENTLKRTETHHAKLFMELGDGSLLDENRRSQVLVLFGALNLSLNQLEKLHSIAGERAELRYEADTNRMKMFLIPIMGILILMGAGSFGYIYRQIDATLTRLAEAERQLQAVNCELEQRVTQRTAELRAAQDELVRKERLATLGQLTGTVSHELRNPLGAMRASIAAIKRLAADEHPLLRSAMGIVDRSITRCDNIVGDLLDYSKVRNLEPQPTAVDDWLEEVLDEYTLPAGVTLRRDLAADVEVTFDRDRFRRVMVNVLDNACQAMANEEDEAADGKGRLLTVATRSAGDCLEVSVGDTGAGIPLEDMPKMFEPLYSTKSFGVGLGLPIVKGIMDQHGGSIDFDSEAGRGTRVSLRLPLMTTALRAAS
jgi:signal transduction histidine kinase